MNTTIEIKLSPSLHQSLTELANREQITVDQFVSTAIAEKMSAWNTADIFTQRAALADKAKFRAAMAKVGAEPVSEEDRI